MTPNEAMESAERNAELARRAFELTDEFIRIWNSLHWKDQRTMSYALGHDYTDGFGLAELARSIGETRQGIWARVDLICKKYPAMNETLRARQPSWLAPQEEEAVHGSNG